MRDRQHRFPGRRNALKVLYDDVEVAAVRSAAEVAGLTPTRGRCAGRAPDVRLLLGLLLLEGQAGDRGPASDHRDAHVVAGCQDAGLRDAAEHYERAIRPPRGRVPAATPVSRALRTAARGMLTAGIARNRDTRQLLQLMTQLARLARPSPALRETEQQAAGAGAARQAAEQLLNHAIAAGAAQTTGTGQDRAAYFPQGLTVDHVEPGWPPAPSRATAARPSRRHTPRTR